MVTFRDIALALGGTSDSPMTIHGVSASTSPKANTISFTRSWDAETAETVAANPETLFIVPLDAGIVSANTVCVENPRLAYAYVVRDFLQPHVPAVIASTAVIADSAEIGERVSIGHFAVIEDSVVIGDGSSVGPHTLIRTGVRVGSNTRIGSHTSIGGPGFGFEMDDAGHPLRIAHMGGVIIGDSVEIGQHVTIAQGTIEPTQIGDHVKIDDGVFVAHNVSVGENSFLIAGAEISGSVKIGRGVWISPEATLINKISVGDDALVGIGAVVVRDVERNTVVAGVPAKSFGERYKH